MRKRLLSLAMALCMVLSLLPATAFADENAETPVCTCEEKIWTQSVLFAVQRVQLWKTAANIQCLQRKHRQR